MKSRPESPASVKIIGWFYVVVSGMMFFSGVMGYMAWHVIEEMRRIEGLNEGPPFPSPFRLMEIMFRYYDVLAILQVLVSVIILVTSIQFLRLKRWARTGIEIISWLALLYVLGFGTYWVVSWLSILSMPVKEAGPPVSPLVFDIFGAVMGAAITLIFAIALFVIIRFLRKEEIRQIFQ